MSGSGGMLSWSRGLDRDAAPDREHLPFLFGMSRQYAMKNGLWSSGCRQKTGRL
jgi:hypothetical protein